VDGDRTACPPRLANDGDDHRVIGQRRIGAEPAMPGCQGTKGRHLATTHQPGAGDVALGIALAQPHQDRSILEHLESPAPHRAPPRTKVREGSGNARQFEMPVTLPLARICRSATGSITPIRRWLEYADHAVARICRSRGGSNMPITRWLEYADR
jgi:hypothetical protein